MDEQDCFDEQVSTQYESTTVPRHNACYGYMFINKGDTGVTINQKYLKPYPPGRPDLSGEAYSFVDPLRSVYKGKDFQVMFDAAPNLDPRVEIIQYHKIV